jgi:hypothetical protein
VSGENYLRGVQVTASHGTVTFTTVFPGCYSGRMPHIHFEIYRDANTATAFSNKLKTSQIALPDDICSTVYANASGYSASVANLARISFATDNVFSDGVSAQLATVTGSVANGYAARLVVGITIRRSRPKSMARTLATVAGLTRACSESRSAVGATPRRARQTGCAQRSPRRHGRGSRRRSSSRVRRAANEDAHAAPRAARS